MMPADVQARVDQLYETLKPWLECPCRACEAMTTTLRSAVGELQSARLAAETHLAAEAQKLIDLQEALECLIERWREGAQGDRSRDHVLRECADQLAADISSSLPAPPMPEEP